MFRAASIALLGAALIGGTASAQVALPTAPPSSPSNPTQDGLYARVGQTESGNTAIIADGGRQAPVQALVSQDRTAPKSDGSVEVYARLPKGENGVPTGADVRVQAPGVAGQPGVYQGVQLLGQ
jgi:hypothetical protein